MTGKVRFEPHPCAVLYGYHPESLVFDLVEQPYGGPDHPLDPDGSFEPAVGVHQVFGCVSFETVAPGCSSGVLLWHEVPLAAWTQTRAVFAAAEPEVQAAALATGPAFGSGVFGTHLGATVSTVTADRFVVFRSRQGKYAEAALFDSLLAGTLMVRDLDAVGGDTNGYFAQLFADANLSGSGVVERFHPTHLAARRADFGLWIGGWCSVALSARELADAVPFETVAVPLDADVPVPLTPWARFDLDAMRVHLAGRHLRDALWLP